MSRVSHTFAAPSEVSLRALVLIALSMLLALAVPVVSRAEDGPVYRTGFVVIENYNFEDANGQWRGYDIELMLQVSQYADFDLDPVVYASADDALQALRDGDVDLLFDFSVTPERQEEFLFSEHPVASEGVDVFVPNSDERFSFGDLAQLDGCSVSYIEGSAALPYLQEACAEHDVTVRGVAFESSSEALAALDAGEVDACVLGSATPKGYQAVYTIESVESYALFRQDEADVKSEVDTAMAELYSEHPAYLYDLTERYASDDDDETITLTSSERAYLAEHGPIVVALPRSAAPYTYEQDGEAEGIVPDYYRLLAERLGTTIEFSLFDTTDEATDAVQSGEADVLGQYFGDVVTAQGSGIDLTEPYTSFDCSLVTKEHRTSTDITKVAASARTADVLRAKLEEAQIDFEVVAYANVDTCYDAMRAGEVDAVLCMLDTSTWLINQHAKGGLAVISLSGITVDLSGCVLNNSPLRPILNKAIGASTAEFRQIVAANSVTDSTNLVALIESIPTTLLAGVVLALIALLVVLVVTLIALRRRNRERALVAQERAENERRQVVLDAERRNNERQNQFFSNISHDMRTPLNAIMGFADLAQKTDDPAVVRDYLGKIDSSGSILLGLIDDTLTVGKMGSGKFELDVRDVSLRRLLSEVSIPIEAAAQRKGLTYVEDVPEKDVVVRCDGLNTQKVLLNLLSNAVKYTEAPGTVWFSVTCEGPTADEADVAAEGDVPDVATGSSETATDTGIVTVTAVVSDNGIGMDEKFLPQVFEPFTQEQANTGEVSGVGLGLSIVKSLVDMMGGTIGVESTRGEGSTFTVTLPFEIASPHAQEALAYQEQASKGEGTLDLTGRKVLLCEDNAMNAEIAATLLRTYGAEVTVAEDGRRGVEAFAESEPGEFACVLMDVRMPELDGYGATREIRAMDRPDAQGVPIVAMTADAFESDIEQCLEAGMNWHLPKPIDVALLERTLLELL